MKCLISNPCEAAGQEFDVRDEDPGDGGFDERFEILGEPKPDSCDDSNGITLWRLV